MKCILNSILSTILVLSVYFGVLEYTDSPDRILLNGRVVYVEGETYDDVWEAYDNLPPKLHEMLENGYTIYIVDNIDNDELIAGRAIYGPKMIEICHRTYNVEYIFYHECGHVLDDESSLGMISNTDEFEEIYTEEKYTVVMEYNYDYGISTKAEYFASCFAEYMTNPERLKATAPRTYYFIESCLD